MHAAGTARQTAVNVLWPYRKTFLAVRKSSACSPKHRAIKQHIKPLKRHGVICPLPAHGIALRPTLTLLNILCSGNLPKQTSLPVHAMCRGRRCKMTENLQHTNTTMQTACQLIGTAQEAKLCEDLADKVMALVSAASLQTAFCSPGFELHLAPYMHRQM